MLFHGHSNHLLLPPSYLNNNNDNNDSNNDDNANDTITTIATTKTTTGDGDGDNDNDNDSSNRSSHRRCCRRRFIIKLELHKLLTQAYPYLVAKRWLATVLRPQLRDILSSLLIFTLCQYQPLTIFQKSLNAIKIIKFQPFRISKDQCSAYRLE